MPHRGVRRLRCCRQAAPNENNSMKRLPGLEPASGRAESVVHLLLGLAAAAVICLATQNGFEFAGNLDCIAANLSAGPIVAGSKPVHPETWDGQCVPPRGPAGRTVPRTSVGAPDN